MLHHVLLHPGVNYEQILWRAFESDDEVEYADGRIRRGAGILLKETSCA